MGRTVVYLPAGGGTWSKLRRQILLQETAKLQWQQQLGGSSLLPTAVSERRTVIALAWIWDPDFPPRTGAVAGLCAGRYSRGRLTVGTGSNTLAWILDPDLPPRTVCSQVRFAAYFAA